MKSILTTLLIMILSPLAMLFVSGLYFGVAFWLTGGPRLSWGQIGEIAGRISFILGVPAGGLIGFAVLAKSIKKQGSRALDSTTALLGFGLVAVLVLLPLYSGFGQSLDLLALSRFGFYLGIGFVVLVGWIIYEIDKSMPDV